MGAEPQTIYTTKQLADLAGVSARTLRYYDQIGLLVPQRTSNGYRTYSAADDERMLTMSKPAWDAKEELEQRIKDSLVTAMATGDPRSAESRLVAGMHAQWIKVHWGEDAYTPQAHVALAEGYLADPRFVSYYDGAAGEGATAFLCAIIKENIGSD